MPLRAVDLEPGRIYARAELLEQGAHSRLLASADLLRILPGHYTRADAPASLLETVRMLTFAVVPGAVISHETAAELMGLPLPRDLTRAHGAALHCSLARAGTRRRSRTVVFHPCTPAPQFLVRGVRTSHPVVVLQELSGRLTSEELVMGLDAIAGGRGEIPAIALPRVREVARGLRGRGSATVRAALPHMRENVWSPMETRTRLLLLARGFPEPEPNCPVIDPVTGQRFVIDLAYRDRRIAIEYDGEVHRLDARRWRRDLHKNEVLHALGWIVLRISIADLRAPTRFLRRLAAAMGARSA